MSGVINYLSCGALWFGLTVKLPDLVRNRRDRFLRTICVVMALAGLCFLLGAPPTVGAINRVSGVPNLAAPLTYASITAYCAASLVLIVYWRGGPHVRRTARFWMSVYALVLIGIAATFVAGEAAEERRTDFDTYYATTPYVSEMIVLYLVAHLTAATVTAARSLGWARGVDGWLRAGLLTMGAGTVVGAGYSVCKLTAVVALWCGRDWSALSSEVSPGFAGLGALMTVLGILIPLVGPRLTGWRRSWRAFVRLRPLDRALDEVLTSRKLRLPRPCPSSPGSLLTWRQTSITNGLFFLDGLFDHELYAQTHAAVLHETGDRRRAEATAWAVIITAAVRGERSGQAPSDAGRLAGQAPDPAVLEGISEALATSDTVATARTYRRATEGAL